MRQLTIDNLSEVIGTEIGTSQWVTVDQSMVDRFAETTGDAQWVHVDPERAAQGPFGTTIAHGFLTLSIVPRMLRGIYKVTGLSMTANYGLNRVRFPTPVRTGSRLRTHAELISLEQTASHAQITVRATVELEGSEKPACVADIVMRLTPDQT